MTPVQKKLAKALSLSAGQFGEMVRKDEALLTITIKKNNKKEETRKLNLWAKYVPLECLQATYDVIRDAWERHRQMLIDYQVEQFQARAYS